MKLRRQNVFTAIYIAITSIVLITGQDIKEDRVCYLDDLTPACNSHRLGCIRDEIAFLSAEYSSATNCTCVKRKCTSCRSAGRSVPLQPSGTCSNEYYTDDYWTIITKCSKKRDCTYPVPSQRHYNECSSMTAFSHLRYRCVDDRYEADICGGNIQFDKTGSLYFSGAESSMTKHRCQCTVVGTQPEESDTYTVTAMDVRMKDEHSRNSAQLVLTSLSINVTVTSQMLRPNTPLLTASSMSPTRIHLDVRTNFTPERIWLLIDSAGSSQLKVTCESVTLPNTKELATFTAPTADSLLGGLFLAGVGACAVVLLLIALLVYVFIIKRRYDITRKKQHDNVPASVDHPTYAGLFERDLASSYDVISDNRTANPRLSTDYQNT